MELCSTRSPVGGSIGEASGNGGLELGGAREDGPLVRTVGLDDLGALSPSGGPGTDFVSCAVIGGVLHGGESAGIASELQGATAWEWDTCGGGCIIRADRSERGGPDSSGSSIVSLASIIGVDLSRDTWHAGRSGGHGRCGEGGNSGVFHLL